MRYRVSYGNGQVSHTMTKRECYAEIRRANDQNEPYTGYYRVQFQDPDTGDWFNCGK